MRCPPVSPAVEEDCPKVLPLLIKLLPPPPTPGFRKLGWFRRSKKFASNLKPIVSPILNVLLTPKSTLAKLGPGIAFRLRLGSHQKPPWVLIAGLFRHWLLCANW